MLGRPISELTTQLRLMLTSYPEIKRAEEIASQAREEPRRRARHLWFLSRSWRLAAPIERAISWLCAELLPEIAIPAVPTPESSAVEADAERAVAAEEKLPAASRRALALSEVARLLEERAEKREPKGFPETIADQAKLRAAALLVAEVALGGQGAHEAALRQEGERRHEDELRVRDAWEKRLDTLERWVERVAAERISALEARDAIANKEIGAQHDRLTRLEGRADISVENRDAITKLLLALVDAFATHAGLDRADREALRAGTVPENFGHGHNFAAIGRVKLLEERMATIETHVGAIRSQHDRLDVRRPASQAELEALSTLSADVARRVDALERDMSATKAARITPLAREVERLASFLPSGKIDGSR